MRKILSAILVAGLLGLLVTSTAVLAQPSQGPNECCKLSNDIPSIEVCKKGEIVGPTKSAICDEGEVTATTTAWAMCCTLDIVYKVTNWIFFVMLLLVVLLIIIGGLLYITAAGDAEKAGKGKSLILYAIIGLAIGLLAKIIPGVVAFII